MQLGGAARIGTTTQCLNRVISDLRKGVPIAVSLAPSFPAAFFPLPPVAVFQILREAGFISVEETASVLPMIIEERRRLARDGLKFYIANSCPVVVSLINREYPHLRSYIFPGLTPMLSHAALLKKRFGSSTQVLFIGPCGAKKKEAAANPGLVDYALTFREVMPWLEEKYRSAWRTRSLSLAGCSLDPALNRARRAVLAVAAGGRQAVKAVLDRLPADPPGPFLELLECSGGCLGGPGMPNKLGVAERRKAVERYVAWIEEREVERSGRNEKADSA